MTPASLEIASRLRRKGLPTLRLPGSLELPVSPAPPTRPPASQKPRKSPSSGAVARAVKATQNGLVVTLRSRGNTGVSLCPASRDQAREVIPLPEVQNLGGGKRPPHLRPEKGGRSRGPAARSTPFFSRPQVPGLVPTAGPKQLKLPALVAAMACSIG